MIEFYKEVARYRADIEHENSGNMIDLHAIVYEGPHEGQYAIRYSHTYKPTMGAGFYYSNAATRADSLEDAERTVRDWAASIRSSYEVGPWVEGL